MKVGVDIVLVNRFDDLIDDKEFLTKYFTTEEVNYISSKVHKNQTMAGIFAAKEAFLKALGIGIGKGLTLHEINVCYEKTGKPFIEQTPKIDNLLDEIGLNNIEISISHTDLNAVAFCVLN